MSPRQVKAVLHDFPVCLQLAGRPVAVVGAGEVATRRIESLLAAEADVRVIAPSATERVAALAKAGTIVWVARVYRRGDLAGVQVAFAATDDFEVNRRVAADALQRGILVNVADDPVACDFTMPAVARRGRVTVAVSTDGTDPAGAGRLRDVLARHVDASGEAAHG